MGHQRSGVGHLLPRLCLHSTQALHDMRTWVVLGENKKERHEGSVNEALVFPPSLGISLPPQVLQCDISRLQILTSSETITQGELCY